MTDPDAPLPPELLDGLARGDAASARDLAPLVYERLRALAGRLLARGGVDPVLQPTVLVHEAYAQLAGGADADWRGRTHFLAVAAKAMRDVLVDQCRRANAGKRGGGWNRVTTTDLADERAAVDHDVLALHAALDKLALLDPRAARVVELRFFAGLSGDEIAEALGISRATVVRELTAARAWLARELDAAG